MVAGVEVAAAALACTCAVASTTIQPEFCRMRGDESPYGAPTSSAKAFGVLTEVCARSPTPWLALRRKMGPHSTTTVRFGRSLAMSAVSEA